jgi:RNA polymerase sigma factor (TIGR02999 family)
MTIDAESWARSGGMNAATTNGDAAAPESLPHFAPAVMLPFMSEVTRILSAIEAGDRSGASEEERARSRLAAEELLPLVYDELRKLAAAKLSQEKPGQTLDATGLVHEAYLRLVDVEQAQQWSSRGHFFAAAAEAMRRIVLDRARDKGRLKRGGDWRRISLEQIEISVTDPPKTLLALDQALQKLAEEDPPCAELVKLRFFAGLTLDEAAKAMGIGRRTADRYWAFARSWIFDALKSQETK